jgi:hypothetical protein
VGFRIHGLSKTEVYNNFVLLQLELVLLPAGFAAIIVIISNITALRNKNWAWLSALSLDSVIILPLCTAELAINSTPSNYGITAFWSVPAFILPILYYSVKLREKVN